MSPGLPVGAIAFVRPVDPATVEPGDVITFQRAPDAPELVTHRVLAVDASSGVPVFTTKGDANEDADVNATPIGRIRGVQLAVHKGWGWVLQWAGSPQGRAVMLVPPLVALATLELLAMGDARRERRGDPVSRPDSADRRVDELLLD